MIDAKWSRRWVSGGLVIYPSGLDNGCQVDVLWPGYLHSSVGNQRVIWRSGVCPDVYPDIDAGLESSKVLSSQAS